MYKTDQENFWAGDFGDNYIMRNSGAEVLRVKVGWFARILSGIPGEKIKSCLELGSNIGLNLRALNYLIPGLSATAVEINEKAAVECAKIPNVKVFNGSIFEYDSEELYDLTFTSGVMIHINPDELTKVYDALYKHSRKYILIAEYYNPTPVQVNYRGNSDRLFKRDFAGEFLDRFPDTELVNYGFVYHRDKVFPADDINWFLIRK